MPGPEDCRFFFRVSVKGPGDQRQKLSALCDIAGGILVWVRVVVTEIASDGNVRRRALDTWCLAGPARWEHLIEQVLACPPPYQAAPGSSVYVIHASDRAVLVGEQNLTGPLRDLVTAILAADDPT